MGSPYVSLTSCYVEFHHSFSFLFLVQRQTFGLCLCVWEGQKIEPLVEVVSLFLNPAQLPGPSPNLLHEHWKKWNLHKLNLDCGLVNQALGRKEGDLHFILFLLFIGFDLTSWESQIPHLWNEGICTNIQDHTCSKIMWFYFNSIIGQNIF